MYKHHSLLIIPAILFVFDRLIKHIVYTLPLGEVFSFPGLKFGYFLNPALFFLPSWSWLRWLALIVLVSLAIFFLVKAGEHKKARTGALGSMLFALCFILLGGASNVYDRFIYNGVIDVVNIFGLATINLADLLIATGIIGLLLNNQNQKSNQLITQ